MVKGFFTELRESIRVEAGMGVEKVHQTSAKGGAKGGMSHEHPAWVAIGRG